MKTKFKENHKNISSKGFRSAGHSYYFHSDEDFREDRNWGKESSVELQSKSGLKNMVKDPQ